MVVCVFGMLNYYIYNAGLVSNVLATDPKIPINSLDDLKNKQDFTLLVQEGSAQESYLRYTVAYKEIWENTVKRDGLLGNENVNEGEQK